MAILRTAGHKVDWLEHVVRQLKELDNSLGEEDIKAKMYIHTGASNLEIALEALKQNETDAIRQRVE